MSKGEIVLLNMEEEDYFFLDEDDNPTDYWDHDCWDIDKSAMARLIEENVKPPYKLTAIKSRWNGSTGYADAETAEDVVEKSLSFDNNHITLCKDEDKDELYIRTGNHDVPIGFRIIIEHKNAKR